MRNKYAIRLACILLLPLIVLTAAPAKAGASISLGVFYDSLSPYGDWHVSADFGYVWRPAHVSVGWRPYVDGRWAYSEVGWTFVSYEPWGWGPYHYGRWYLDPIYGWVWVPGYEWSPAWVTFYEGPGWIGWAPLPPRVALGVSFASPIRVDPRAYCFVESRSFLDPYVGRRIQPIGRNATLVRSVRDVSRFERVRGVMVNRGPAVDRVERAVHARVRTFRLADETNVARVSRSAVRGDSISVFRPKVERGAARPDRVAPGRPARYPGHAERTTAPARTQVRAPARVEKRPAPPPAAAPRSQQLHRSERTAAAPVAGSRSNRSTVSQQRVGRQEGTTVVDPRSGKAKPTGKTRATTARAHGGKATAAKPSTKKPPPPG